MGLRSALLLGADTREERASSVTTISERNEVWTLTEAQSLFTVASFTFYKPAMALNNIYISIV